MPFTTKENRKKMLNALRFHIYRNEIIPEVEVEAGDWCFLAYREMMIAWEKEPRWTTAHAIKRKMNREVGNRLVEFTIDSRKVYIVNNPDLRTALQLAWEVFFNIHVMEYERKKREENGDV